MSSIGSLCTGTGALDSAVQSVLDGELAWVSDPDPGASALLAHHYPEVPNLGDLTAVDWATVEPVDILTAGFPCQDVSSAGRRAGLRHGNRTGLWLHIVDIIDQLRPSLVILENVRGLLSADADSAMEPCPWCVGDGPGTGLRALGALLGDLADLGFDAEWQMRPASADGAPHRRERVFIVASPTHAENVGHQRTRSAWSGWSGDPDHPDHAVSNPEGHGRREGRPESARLVGGSDAAVSGDAVADSAGTGRGAQGDSHRFPCRQRLAAREAVPGRRDGTAADADGERLAGRSERDGEPVQPGQQAPCGPDADGRVLDWGGYRAAIQRWERILGRRAPAPTVLGLRGARQLSSVFVEWMQGLPEGWVTAVPGLSRNQQLKLLGNGIVVHQAESALRLLLPRLTSLEGVAA